MTGCRVIRRMQAMVTNLSETLKVGARQVGFTVLMMTQHSEA